ncbi:MAG TPA: DUF6800 family protein [Caulifigura sp.]|nr:DUF6800 family protein [Caulifigura sp.]
MGRTERNRELARKRTRRAKLKKLRTKFAAAKLEGDKKSILTKARKVSAFVEFEAAAAKK